MKTLSYSEKVKKASVIYNAIKGLKEDNELSIEYKGTKYVVTAYTSYNDNMSYSVWSGHRGMNVSKVGKTSLALYSYDMMSTKTTYRMSLLDATLLPESK